MNANADSIVSVADATRDFSKAACADFSGAEKETALRDEDVMEISRHLIEKNREAYETLA